MVEHYDFVVVGGGVTGASAVAELAKKGEGQTVSPPSPLICSKIPVIDLLYFRRSCPSL